MRELRDLGLTSTQMSDVLAADPLLVSAWLDRVDDPSIDNPAAFFIVGVRSGIFPFQLADAHRAKRIKTAEHWIKNAGLFVPVESEVLHELFDGPSALLRSYADEQPLRERIVTLWRLERPHGEEIEAESLARSERIRESRNVIS
jgi:hypothetical protein